MDGLIVAIRGIVVGTGPCLLLDVFFEDLINPRRKTAAIFETFGPDQRSQPPLPIIE